MATESTRSATRAAAVLEAATVELMTHGFTALTMESVAVRAHASKSTIYKNWPTKVDLIAAVVEAMDVVETPRSSGASDIQDALQAIVASVRSITLGERGQLLLVLHEASRADKRIATSVEAHLVTPLQESVARSLRHLQQGGVIAATVDPDVAARVITSIVVDRALASGEAIGDTELGIIVEQWLVPALSPHQASGQTAGPTAGPG